MKKLHVTITPGEQPPTPEVISSCRAELAKLKYRVSGTCTIAIAMGLIGFVGLQWALARAALGEIPLAILFAVGLPGFLFGRQYEIVLDRRLAEVSPVPERLMAEAAALGNASPTAQEYVAELRMQKREMTMAELDALKRLLAATPPALARQTLYG